MMLLLAALDWEALEPYAPIALGALGALAAVMAAWLLVVALRRLRRRRPLDYDAGPIEVLAEYPPAPEDMPFRVRFEASLCISG